MPTAALTTTAETIHATNPISTAIADIDSATDTLITIEDLDDDNNGIDYKSTVTKADSAMGRTDNTPTPAPAKKSTRRRNTTITAQNTATNDSITKY
jgi:hypothetical protein